MAKSKVSGSQGVTRAAGSRSIARRLEGSSPAALRLSRKVTNVQQAEENASTPECPEVQKIPEPGQGAEGRLVMRSVGLDLGVRYISYCEVVGGEVVDRTTVKSMSQLTSRIGPKCPPARVAFEACREGWHVHKEVLDGSCNAYRCKFEGIGPVTIPSIGAEGAF